MDHILEMERSARYVARMAERFGHITIWIVPALMLLAFVRVGVAFWEERHRD